MGYYYQNALNKQMNTLRRFLSGHVMDMPCLITYDEKSCFLQLHSPKYVVKYNIPDFGRPILTNRHKGTCVGISKKYLTWWCGVRKNIYYSLV